MEDVGCFLILWKYQESSYYVQAKIIVQIWLLYLLPKMVMNMLEKNEISPTLRDIMCLFNEEINSHLIHLMKVRNQKEVLDQLMRTMLSSMAIRLVTMRHGPLIMTMGQL